MIHIRMIWLEKTRRGFESLTKTKNGLQKKINNLKVEEGRLAKRYEALYEESLETIKLIQQLRIYIRSYSRAER